ncbi:MAG: hypothetical protein J6B65_05450 [Paludibacteraceae bacterium]|nr:hypothetical protein [Paludibacteraceae bacterium]
MKKFFTLVATFLCSAHVVFSQIDTTAIETVEIVEETSNTGELIANILMSILVLGAILAIIGHMIYELFILKKRPNLILEDQISARKDAGLAPMTDDEAQILINKMIDDTEKWTPFTNEKGEKDYIPTKHSQMKKTEQVLNEILATTPDHEDVVEAYNDLTEIYNDCMKRKYNGSTTYIVISAIAGIAISLLSGTYGLLVFFGISIGIYAMASMTPTYLLNKKALKGNNRPKFMSGFIAGILGLAATAETVTTVTKWSDGTTTREDDNSQVFISLIITVVLVVLLAIFMFVVSFFNYLRNYIFHF